MEGDSIPSCTLFAFKHDQSTPNFNQESGIRGCRRQIMMPSRKRVLPGKLSFRSPFQRGMRIDRGWHDIMSPSRRIRSKSMM